MLLSSKMFAPVLKLYVIVLIYNISANAGLVQVKRAVETKAELKQNSYDFSSPEWTSKYLKNKIKQKDAVTFDLGTPQYEILNPDEEPEIITSDQPNYYENLRLYGQLSDYDEYRLHNTKQNKYNFEQQNIMSSAESVSKEDHAHEYETSNTENENLAPNTQQVLKTEKPVESVESVESQETGESEKSMEQEKSMEHEKSMEQEKSVEHEKSLEQEKSMENEQPMEPEETVKSAELVKPMIYVKPKETAIPITHVESARPFERAIEVASSQPAQPETYIEPFKPVQFSKSAKLEKEQYEFVFVKPKREKAMDFKTAEEAHEEQQASMISSLYKSLYEQQPQHQYFAGNGYLDAGDGQKIPLYDSEAESETEAEPITEYKEADLYRSYQTGATDLQVAPPTAGYTPQYAPYTYSPYASYPSYPSMYPRVGSPPINPLNYYNYNYNYDGRGQLPHMRDLEHLYHSAISFHDPYGHGSYMYPQFMYPRNNYY